MVKRKSGLGSNPFQSGELGIFSLTEPAVTNVSDQPEDSSASNPFVLLLTEIVLPQQQPRRYFDPEKMEQLAQSIRVHGILEPLLVRPLSSEKYELVAGERRYRAAKEVGLEEVPVSIRSLSDDEALQIALVENLQREDLNPVEETEGILNLLAIRLRLPVSEVSSLLHRLARSSDNVVGKARAVSGDSAKKSSDNVVGTEETLQRQAIQEIFEQVGSITWESFATHRLPLLNLPAPILEALRSGKLEYTKARAIARLKDEGQQKKLLKEAIAQNFSLAQIKERITNLKAEAPTKTEAPALKNQIDDVLRLAKRSKVWDDPKKQKKLEKLLADFKSLVSDMP
ncbi:ParB/RepB/Spo0J family partition protein [Phormidium tenue FACHB-886]|nr:ParB/RepB/Spo0J family partition protein [Phormidium tenue FACHB-886]